MPVNNYLRECKYNLNNLDNYIYLYEFNEPLLDYITDDEESNASASDIKGSAQRLYCESVTYSSTSSVDNRFSFDNTLTVTLAEHSKVSHYSIIQTLLNNNWMVVFKNKEDEAFVVNAEYPVMVSYSYVINDEKTPNILTITFRALQNVPTINLKTSVAFSSTLCDKPCEYVISRIKSLKMIDMNKATIDFDNDGFTLNEKGEGNLKTIEFNPMSMSFTDSFDGREFSQTLSFQIPFEMYRFYFHYNLLEYLDNRYYALIETTNDNNILGGFRQGLFPSYTVSTSDGGNLITINLNAKYVSYSVLGSDTMNITTSYGMFYKPVLGECVNNIYTWTLIEQFNANGISTNGYYCLSGFEDIYSDYTILGIYNQFDTNFGFKLFDFNIDCYKGCIINNLPSSIQFETSGETKCYTLDTNCSVTWEWNGEAIDFTFDEITKEMCVTSKVDEGTFNIKATSTDGTIQYITVVIGSGGITGDTTTTLNITAEGQKVTIIPVKGLHNVKSITSTLQYITNQNGNGYEVTVPENTTEEPRTFTLTIIYNDNSIETINIIQDRIFYKIVISEETECYGNDLFYINKKYKGYAETDINIFVENIKGNIKETDSTSCLDFDEKVSGCTNCFEGYIYTLYEYKKDGSTIATRYEKTTETCTNNATTQYQLNTGKVICVNDKPYYKEELFGINCKDNTTYIRLYPNIERISNTEATNSNACDVIDPDNPDGTVLYRWVDTNETYCLSGETEGGDVQTGCTTSTTNTNYTILGISVVDENGKNLGGFVADGDNIINTNLSVAWDKSIIIDECSYTYETKTVNTNCTITTTQNTGTTFTTLISSTENESTEYQETVTITIKTGNTIIGYATFYRNQKTNEDDDTSDSGSTENTGSTSGDVVGVGDLSFEFSGSSFEYRLNEKLYTATSSPYSTTLEELNISNLTNCSRSFENSKITKFISFPDTSNVTNMYMMFNYCTVLSSLNLVFFNTSNVEYMSHMFSGCHSLTSLNISSFNTSKITNMESMFSQCYNLTSLNVSSFDTSNVTNMSTMFTSCSGLTSLDVSNFNTSGVTNMSHMFYGCSSLTSLDLSNFNTSNVVNMKYMFSNCKTLTSLDLSNFDTSKGTNMESMFYECTNLTILNVSGWDVKKVSYNFNNIFKNCTSLNKLIIGNVNQTTYNWWCNCLTIYDIDCNIIEYTLIS